MIKQLAISIASFLVRENIIDKDDADIYSFGAEQILINLTTFLTVAIISSVFDIWLEAIFFFIGLMPIRLVAGGYHAKTHRDAMHCRYLFSQPK
jgi:accessory gene regulator B